MPPAAPRGCGIEGLGRGELFRALWSFLSISFVFFRFVSFHPPVTGGERLHRVTTLPCRRVKLRASLQRPLVPATLPAPGLRQTPAEHPGAVRESVPRPCGGCLRSQNPSKGSAPPRRGERAHRRKGEGSRERSFVVIEILPPCRDRICSEAIPQAAGLSGRAAAPGEGWPFPRGSALIYVRTAARRGRPRTAGTATSHGEAAGPGAPTRDGADGGDVPGLASHAADTCRCSARSGPCSPLTMSVGLVLDVSGFRCPVRPHWCIHRVKENRGFCGQWSQIQAGDAVHSPGNIVFISRCSVSALPGQ
ncbi:uncharacterized protein LOC136010071 [Lathamus discolor]|uniref:uncharacterized protein LOC136010071 n=1 Tax=Lathamus discolor TaxID=678569 RepID=UPI0032B7CF5B